MKPRKLLFGMNLLDLKTGTGYVLHKGCVFLGPQERRWVTSSPLAAPLARSFIHPLHLYWAQTVFKRELR